MSLLDKSTVISNFDPNGVGISGQLFGLPFSSEEAEMVVIPVPWEVTVSYSAGTANGPDAILQASVQVDLFQEDIREAWKMGITILPQDEELRTESEHQRTLAASYIQWLEALKPEAERGQYEK